MHSDDNAHMNEYRGRLELEIENLKEQCRWKIFPHEKPKNHEYVLVADKDKLNYALAQYVHMSFHVCPGTPQTTQNSPVRFCSPGCFAYLS